MSMGMSMIMRNTIMTTEPRPPRPARFSLIWRLVAIGLVALCLVVLGPIVLGLGIGSFLPLPGNAQSAGDSLRLDLDGKTDRPNLWTRISHDADGYRELTFEHFNDFVYTPPAGASINMTMPPVPADLGQPFEERIPEQIRELDGQKIAVLGFLIPLEGSMGAMTSFVLVRNMMICCYGVEPKINEWIMAEASDKQKLRFQMNVPVLLRGVLKIDEVIEEGFVVSLFEMEAHDLEVVDYREFEDYLVRTGVN